MLSNSFTKFIHWGISCFIVLFIAFPRIGKSQVTITPDTIQVCIGGMVNFVATVPGNDSTYIWSYASQVLYQDSLNTFAVITSPGNFPIGSYTIKCKVIFQNATADSSCAQLTVVSPPQAPNLIKLPAVDTVCEGESLSVIATGTGGGTGSCNFVYEYQAPNSTNWVLDSNFIAIGTGIAKFRVKIICSGEGCDDSPYEEVAWVVVQPNSIAVSSSDTILCLGQSVTLEAEVPMNALTCSYDWEKSRDAGLSWNQIPNSSSIFSDTPLESGIVLYRCQYICPAAQCADATSEVIQVEVFEIPSVLPFDDTLCYEEGLTIYLGSTIEGSAIFWEGPNATTGIDSITIDGNPVSAPIVFPYQAFSISQGPAQCIGDTLESEITVKPSPPEVLFSEQNPIALCSGTENLILSIKNPADTEIYKWYGRSQDSLFFAGDTTPSIRIQVIPPINTLRLSIVVTNLFSCSTIGNVEIPVSPQLAPQPQPVILNQGDILVSLDNQADSYQWGYDLKSTLEPVFLESEVFQDYFAQNTFDTTQRYYWVQTFYGECYTRTYYNGPEFVVSIEEIGRLFPFLQPKIFLDRSLDRLKVVLPRTYIEPTNLVLRNLTGKILSRQELLPNIDLGPYFISLTGLSRGMYFVQVESGNHPVVPLRFVY